MGAVSWVVTTLTIVLAILCPMSGARAGSVRVLSSDLAFILVCKDESLSALDDAFEAFLKHEGFKVLNLARIQREGGVYLYDVYLIGLDDKRRSVSVISLPPVQNQHAVRPAERHYGVGFTTPPPTQRASDFEDALLMFASKKLGCESRHVERHQNEADVADMYENEIRRIENLFREAEELAGAKVFLRESQGSDFMQSIERYADARHYKLERGDFPMQGRTAVNLRIRISDKTFFIISNFHDADTYELTAYSHEGAEVWKNPWNALISSLSSQFGDGNVTPWKPH
jgi:hypothetical protein